MSELIDLNYKPTDDEPFMNERQKSYFRAKLVAWKNDILREAYAKRWKHCSAKMLIILIWLTGPLQRLTGLLSFVPVTVSASLFPKLMQLCFALMRELMVFVKKPVIRST